MDDSKVVEIRNNANKLIAKYFPGKGVIEIWQKSERTIISFPVGTPVQVCHRNGLTSK